MSRKNTSLSRKQYIGFVVAAVLILIFFLVVYFAPEK